MEISELLKVVLTSSIFAGLISVFVSYFTSRHLKKIDFRNEYYKEILKKRIQAYEYILKQIEVLKAVVLDDDKKPYHNIFCYGEDKFIEFQQNLLKAISLSIWIDDKTTEQLEILNNLFFNLNNKMGGISKSEIVGIGKEYYKKISDKRFDLENSVKRGFYDLHNLKKIFKPKKTNRKRAIYYEI